MSVAKAPESAIERAVRLVWQWPSRRSLLVLLGFMVLTAIVRLPSFFEPPWHTDEGIFQAVAQRVANGGRLYADAWESKPPLFLYIYVGVLKVFGAGVLPIRLAAASSALVAELALYGVARRWLSTKASVAAAAMLALFLAVPFWEGNLALTETFAVAPTTLAVLCMLRWEAKGKPDGGFGWLFTAGVLFGLAFLIRQTSAYVAAGSVVWLLASGRTWLRPCLIMVAGTAAVVVPIVGVFALFGSFYWFWDANVVFFFDYVESGREIPLYYRPLTLLPCLLAVAAMVVHARRGERPVWTLPALWFTLTLAAAMLTGRPYPHYFLQTFPPLALLVLMVTPTALAWLRRPRVRRVTLSFRSRWPALALAVSVAALWLLVVTPEFGGGHFATRYTKAWGYYPNFARYVTGAQDREAYNDYFDERVNLTARLEVTLARLVRDDDRVYIWGEYPWVYPLANATPATPYVTSFYVLLIPHLDTELDHTLRTVDPRFIVMFGDAWPAIPDYQGVLHRRWNNATRTLNTLIAERYEQVAVVGRARVFARTTTRNYVTDREIAVQAQPEDPVEDEPRLTSRSAPPRDEGPLESKDN